MTTIQQQIKDINTLLNDFANEFNRSKQIDIFTLKYKNGENLIERLKDNGKFDINSLKLDLEKFKDKFDTLISACIQDPKEVSTFPEIEQIKSKVTSFSNQIENIKHNNHTKNIENLKKQTKKTNIITTIIFGVLLTAAITGGIVKCNTDNKQNQQINTLYIKVNENSEEIDDLKGISKEAAVNLYNNIQEYYNIIINDNSIKSNRTQLTKTYNNFIIASKNINKNEITTKELKDILNYTNFSTELENIIKNNEKKEMYEKIEKNKKDNEDLRKKASSTLSSTIIEYFKIIKNNVAMKPDDLFELGGKYKEFETINEKLNKNETITIEEFNQILELSEELKTIIIKNNLDKNIEQDDKLDKHDKEFEKLKNKGKTPASTPGGNGGNGGRNGGGNKDGDSKENSSINSQKFTSAIKKIKKKTPRIIMKGKGYSDQTVINNGLRELKI